MSMILQYLLYFQIHILHQSAPLEVREMYL